MAIPSIAKRRINIALQSKETLRKTHNSMSYNTADLNFKGKITIFFVLIAKKLPLSLNYIELNFVRILSNLNSVRQ